jgi:hypothetical protein
VNAPVPPHDAQREMEQRALRNVRGLVDKVEEMDKVDNVSQRRLLVTIVIAAIVVLGLLVLIGVLGQKQPRGTPVELKLPTSPATPPAAPAK